MAVQQTEATALRISKVLPWHYQLIFMVLEPSIILLCALSITTDPANHYRSLAPPYSSGPFYTFSSAHAICGFESAWNTPQLRSLWYVIVSAFTFTGIVEPLLLYTARYRLRDARDAEEVVRAVLLAFTAFDVTHVTATLAVTGLEAVVPGGPKADVYTMINCYAPLLWIVFRSLWLVGVGRDVSPRAKSE